MGFPTDFFPVLFAIPRVAGWLAHWKEAMEEPSPKIWRPRQIYTGARKLSYVPMTERTASSSEADAKETLPMENHPFNRRYLVSLRSKM